MHTIPFLWTNDDIQYGQTAQLRRQLEFLDRMGIPGVMFMIPKNLKNQTLADDPDLLRLVEKARGKGHEFYQHGYIHMTFESGVPALWMLDLVMDFEPKIRCDYDARRLEIERGHTFEALTAMIEAGHRIWRRAFHEESAGYRPGCGAFCGNLYRALEALGFAWISSQISLPISWLRTPKRWDQPVTLDPKVPVKPWRIGALWEFPLGGDYGFRVPMDEAKIEVMADLGWNEFCFCHQQKAPFTLVSHWHGLEYEGGTGYRVHERLVSRILQSGMAEPMGFAGLLKRYSSSEKDGPPSNNPSGPE